MNNLRRQLLYSHLLLIGLMLLLLVGAVARFFHLGRSIDRVLDANVKSVLLMQRAKDELGELERLGGKDAATAKAVSEAIIAERGNVTEPGERELAERLQSEFAEYQQGKRSYKEVSTTAQAILELNLSAMRQADARAKAEARQSALLGIGITVVASVLALWLVLRTIRDALLPLVSLARQAQEIGAGRLNQRIAVHRSDEIGTLAEAFNDMSQKLTEARAAIENRLIRAERLGDAGS
ncbi:MAG: HAMP domain-containing protein [Armatimonas sp.]